MRTAISRSSFRPLLASLLAIAIALNSFLLAIPQKVEADITSNLAAWWEFEEGTGNTTDDSSANSNTGTRTGSPLPAWTTGKIGNALSFGGVSDSYVSANDDASLDITGTLTIAAWINTDTLAAGWHFIAGKVDEGADTNSYGLTQDGDEILFGFCDDSGAACTSDVGSITTDANLTTGEWYHVAVTYNDTTNTVVFYVNGSSKSHTTAPGFNEPAEFGSIVTSSAPICIGQCYTDTTFDGIIDDVRIYARELTGSDIAELYALGVSPDAPTNLTTTSSVGNVALSWTTPASDGGSDLETYGVWRSTSFFTDTDDATLIASSATSTGTSYSDTSAVHGTNYYYRVTATNQTATSSLSEIRSSSSNSGRIIRLGGWRTLVQ